jgi:NAD(P)-dependent dehydrogenase (short-subunit alcohol dehydrogenase family)
VLVAKQQWTETDIQDLTGRTAVVTGGNAGLGLQISRVLARRGARVVLACRNVEKGKAAAASIGGDTAVVRLDLLINNAGVMDIPYQRTADGFELTFATNHLGHFALTGLVLDRLLAANGSRVVTMSSISHLRGRIDFDDLQGEREYRPEAAYGQSKLANLLFTFELDRRLRAAGAEASALAAHPGVVYTDLFATASKLEQALLQPRLRIINFWAVQDVRMGALPALRAATDPAARGGDYFGPRRHGLRSRFYTGYPDRVEPSETARDAAVQVRLWQVSEQLTGVPFGIA